MLLITSKINLLLICFLISKSLFTQIYCPVEESFFGPVFSVKETQFGIEPEPVVMSNEYINYDDSLQLLSYSYYKVNSGLVTEKQIVDANGSQKCRCTIKYDKNERIIEKITYSLQDSVDTKIVKTWKKNELIRIDRYNRQDEIYSSTVYQSDSKEQTMVSKEVFDDYDDNIVLTEFNSNNLPISKYHIDSSGSRKLFAEFEYNTKNKVITTHIWNSDIRYDQHFFTHYDSKNRVIRREWFDRNNNFIGADSIVYNEQSNVVFERSYDFIKGGWSSNIYKYEYDEYGNVLIKETYSAYLPENKLISRFKREYTYKNEHNNK